MTTQDTAPGVFDEHLRDGDPTLSGDDAARLRILRGLRTDGAVNLADLAFALDRRDALEAELPQIRIDAARAALGDYVHDRDRDVMRRLAGPDRRSGEFRGGDGDRPYRIGIRVAVAALVVVLVAAAVVLWVVG